VTALEEPGRQEQAADSFALMFAHFVLNPAGGIEFLRGEFHSTNAA